MRRRGPPVIALLTDFGTQDVFVGVVKGVIARMAPSAQVIDLTHEVPPGDIRTGAFRLWQALPFLPPHAIILAVVDPGVGTTRPAMAVAVGEVTVVCPDNGLLTYVLAREEIGQRGRAPARAFRIDTPAEGSAESSATFHGRDIFAPAAARLVLGVRPPDLGPPLDALVRLPLPPLRVTAAPLSIRGEVIVADRFGNLVSSIGLLRREGSGLMLQPWIPGAAPVALPAIRLAVRVGGGPPIPVMRTFGEVPPGALLAYVGSDGLLEIAVNGGRAADLLGSPRGAEVVLGSAG